jgi:hypothetical protein
MENHVLPVWSSSAGSSNDTSSQAITLPRYIKLILTLVAALLAALWAMKSYNAAVLSNEIGASGNRDAAAEAVLSNQQILVSISQVNQDSVRDFLYG